MRLHIKIRASALRSLVLLTSHLFGVMIMAQDRDWGSYDRMLVTQRFLNLLYPDLKDISGLLILRTEGIHVGMGSMNEIDVIPCHPGSGVYGGNVPGATPPPRHCIGLYPSGPSDFLFLEVTFSVKYPIRNFSAGGSLVQSKAMSVLREIADHPEWGQEQRIDALRHSNPRFGPENRQELLRIIPAKAIRKFTGCSLQLTTAVLEASRDEAPPDPPIARMAWRISGRSNNAPEHHETCFARFEPFEGRLLSVSDQ